MTGWFSRPVWTVADMDRALDFYLTHLGFTENWRYEQDGARVVEVERAGSQIILSNQWPDSIGRSMIFVSLGEGLLDPLRAELAGRGVHGTEAYWGYRCFVVADPDGNQLYFPYPADEKDGD